MDIILFTQIVNVTKHSKFIVMVWTLIHQKISLLYQVVQKITLVMFLKSECHSVRNLNALALQAKLFTANLEGLIFLRYINVTFVYIIKHQHHHK